MKKDSNKIDSSVVKELREALERADRKAREAGSTTHDEAVEYFEERRRERGVDASED